MTLSKHLSGLPPMHCLPAFSKWCIHTHIFCLKCLWNAGQSAKKFESKVLYKKIFPLCLFSVSIFLCSVHSSSPPRHPTGRHPQPESSQPHPPPNPRLPNTSYLLLCPGIYQDPWGDQAFLLRAELWFTYSQHYSLFTTKNWLVIYLYNYLLLTLQ